MGSTKIKGSADASAVPPNRPPILAWVTSSMDPTCPETASTLKLPEKSVPKGTSICAHRDNRRFRGGPHLNVSGGEGFTARGICIETGFDQQWYVVARFASDDFEGILQIGESLKRDTPRWSCGVRYQSNGWGLLHPCRAPDRPENCRYPLSQRRIIPWRDF